MYTGRRPYFLANGMKMTHAMASDPSWAALARVRSS